MKYSLLPSHCYFGKPICVQGLFEIHKFRRLKGFRLSVCAMKWAVNQNGSVKNRVLVFPRFSIIGLKLIDISAYILLQIFL